MDIRGTANRHADAPPYVAFGRVTDLVTQGEATARRSNR